MGGTPPVTEDLRRTLDFVIEVDRLKSVLRQTLVSDGSRQENSAEHSWHVALMAMALAPYAADPGIDVARVVRMLLCHDIVEADCGDTFCYDEAGMAGKAEREEAAAERLFGLLPDAQRLEFRALWDEFELRETPESRFANALDRLAPMMLNHHTEGYSWRKHGVTADRVIGRNRVIAEGSPELWEYALYMVRDAVSRGWISE